MSQGVPINIPTFEIIKSVLRPSLSTMNAPDMAAIKFHIYRECQDARKSVLISVTTNLQPTVDRRLGTSIGDSHALQHQVDIV